MPLTNKLKFVLLMVLSRNDSEKVRTIGVKGPTSIVALPGVIISTCGGVESTAAPVVK